MIETRLIFDTSTFMLIWMTQLIVYPSFRYFSKDEFKKWHAQYTRSLTLIVAPLLAGQGLSIAYQFFSDVNWYTTICGFLITVVIIYTFVVFIPLHAKLQEYPSTALINKLIHLNWYRAVLWSLLLFLDIAYYLVA